MKSQPCAVATKRIVCLWLANDRRWSRSQIGPGGQRTSTDAPVPGRAERKTRYRKLPEDLPPALASRSETEAKMGEREEKTTCSADDQFLKNHRVEQGAAKYIGLEDRERDGSSTRRKYFKLGPEPQKSLLLRVEHLLPAEKRSRSAVLVE